MLHSTLAVSRELSLLDQALLEEEGVSLPQHPHRKRKLKHFDRGVEDGHSSSSSSSKASGTTATTSAHSEKQWKEIKQYLDPNPQLKGVDKGRYATKVSHQLDYMQLRETETYYMYVYFL